MTQEQIKGYAKKCAEATTETLITFFPIGIEWGDWVRTFLIANELEKRNVPIGNWK